MAKIFNIALILMLSFDVLGQSFIQIRQKSLSEEVSTDFTYNVSGVSGSWALNDRPDAVFSIYDISGDADGALFAIAEASENWSLNPGTIYYKAVGSSQWQNTNSPALKVQGGSNGGYISIVRSAADVAPSNTADHIRYRLNSSSSESDISLNLAGQRFITVAHNYDDMLYALVYTGNFGGDIVGTIYKKSVTDVAWVSTGITDVQSMVAVPNTNRVVYARRASGDVNNIYEVNNDNTGSVSYGNPIPLWNDDTIEHMALTYNESGQPELWVLSVALIYKYTTGGSWVEENGINDMRRLASTGKKMLNTVLLDDASVNIPYRIFLRTQDGIYLDDERVQTTFNSNTVNIPVTPGTYTITQSPVTGWHITDIRINEGVAAGAMTTLTGSPTATVTVTAGEVVVVEFENQLNNSTNLSQICGTNFVENFSSYANGNWGNPLDGLTTYHKATGNFGYGHYAIVPTTSIMSYGDAIFDHTTKDASGSMLLVDATFEKGIFYRRRFTGLQNGAKYSFGGWITNFNPPAQDKPNVSFELYRPDGSLITSVASGDVLSSEWQNFTTVFNSDGNDIELVLRNNTPFTRGNDLAIDDISFGLSIPKPEAKVTLNCASGTSTITVTAPLALPGEDNFEYSLGSDIWQSGTVFSGLTAGSHTVHVRYKGGEGCESTETFTVASNPCIAISGNVWNDGDGDAVRDGGEKPVSGDNTTNGGTSVVTGGSLYASLVDGDNRILKTVQVNADGSFDFGQVSANLPYKVVLTTTEPNVNTSLSEGYGQDNWLATGTSLDGAPSPGNVSYVINLGTVTSNIDDADFGIQQPPVADPKSYVVANSAFSSTPPASFAAEVGYRSISTSSADLTGYPAGGSLSGSDPEDCSGSGTCNTGASFDIVSINDNTILYYNYGGIRGVEKIDVSAGPVNIPNYSPQNLVIYGKTGSGGSDDPFGFVYVIKDKAGANSEEAPYTIQTQTPLPVNLIGFSVSHEHKVASLKWSTTSERNSAGFEIQRSANASTWSGIGFVASQSLGWDSKGNLSYTFTDLSPFSGINYYRLKMVDIDASFAYSSIRSIEIQKGIEYAAYPNPVTQELFLKGFDQKEVVSISILDANGTAVYQSASIPDKGIDVKRLSPGIHSVIVNTKTGRQVFKVIVSQ